MTICINQVEKLSIIVSNIKFQQSLSETIKIGKRNNQNFVSVPFSKLIQMISYKAEEVGIRVKTREESYTSKIDHLANEEMKKQEKYLGRRVKRGLFRSPIDIILNADVNGAIGIMRKVVPKKVNLTLGGDIGTVLVPYKTIV